MFGCDIVVHDIWLRDLLDGTVSIVKGKAAGVVHGVTKIQVRAQIIQSFIESRLMLIIR